MKRSGIFITFEGGEGSGKSSQIGLLQKYLEDNRYEYIFTRSPGGSAIGEKIRDILLATENTDILPLTEVLLHAASYHQNMMQIIIPSLNAGKVVISDRYIHSALVYQGIVRKVNPSVIEYVVINLANGGLIPDRVFYIDVPAEISIARTHGNRDPSKSRIENEPIYFHQSIRQAYLQLDREQHGVIEFIDGTKSADEVHETILTKLKPLLKKAEPSKDPDSTQP